MPSCAPSLHHAVTGRNRLRSSVVALTIGALLNPSACICRAGTGDCLSGQFKVLATVGQRCWVHRSTLTQQQDQTPTSDSLTVLSGRLDRDESAGGVAVAPVRDHLKGSIAI